MGNKQQMRAAQQAVEMFVVDPAQVAHFTALRDQAARELAVACKAMRKAVDTSGEGEASDRMDAAFVAFGVAEDDLREVEYGFRHTYPHPAAFR